MSADTVYDLFALIRRSNRRRLFANRYPASSPHKFVSMPISQIRKDSHAEPIKRPTCPRSRKHLFYLLICIAAVIVNSEARGAASGTYIAIVINENYFVGAADSRVLGLNDAREDFCKIKICGGNVVFLQMGYFARPSNAIDIVCDNIPDTYAVDKIANAWADAIIPAFSDIPRNEAAEMFNHYSGHEAATGFFAGTDKQQMIVVQGIKIIFRDISGAEIKLSKEPFWVLPSTDQPIQGPGSHPDLYREFLLNLSDRAHEANRAVDDVPGVSGVERLALRARALVKFMIDYANDSSIGGTAYAAILERGKVAKWFPSKPSFCPEN